MLTQPLIDKLCSDSAAKIVFDGRRCLRSRLNKNNCHRCLEVCDSGALVLSGRTVIFDAEKCTSCMQCTAECPNDAFAGPVDVLSLLKDLAARKRAVLLSCEKGVGNDDSIVIPCIGFLSEPLLAVINGVVKEDCYIDISRCPECVNSNCLPALHRNIRNFTQKTKNKEEVRLKCHSDKQFDLADGRNDRRSFLRLIRKTIVDIGKESIDLQISGSLKTEDIQAKRQTRILSALQYGFTAVSAESASEKEPLLPYFFSVSANGHCDCCPSCTGMCPTGALKRKKEDDRKNIIFTSSSCSGCGLCVEFCRKDALILERGFSGDPRIALQIK